MRARCCAQRHICWESAHPRQELVGVAGDTEKELEDSPYLEKLLSRDYEVIYFTDSVDEYMMQHLDAFEDIQFQNAVKDKLTLGGNDDKEKKKEKALRVRAPSQANEVHHSSQTGSSDVFCCRSQRSYLGLRNLNAHAFGVE